jgi:hypothetical protein
MAASLTTVFPSYYSIYRTQNVAAVRLSEQGRLENRTQSFWALRRKQCQAKAWYMYISKFGKFEMHEVKAVVFVEISFTQKEARFS